MQCNFFWHFFRRKIKRKVKVKWREKNRINPFLYCQGRAEKSHQSSSVNKVSFIRINIYGFIYSVRTEKSHYIPAVWRERVERDKIFGTIIAHRIRKLHLWEKKGELKKKVHIKKKKKTQMKLINFQSWQRRFRYTNNKLPTMLR